MKLFICPLTGGIETKFVTFDSYKKNCLAQQNLVVQGNYGKFKHKNKEVCSICPNYGKPRELLHGALVMTFSEWFSIPQNKPSYNARF
jgi:hypothetical protein